MPNSDELARWISKGAPKLLTMKDKKAVVVLGVTGSGKSTFLNYILGCKMRTYNNNRIEAVGRPYASIGHSYTSSHTFSPQAYTYGPTIISYRHSKELNCKLKQWSIRSNIGAIALIRNRVSKKWEVALTLSCAVKLTSHDKNILKQKCKHERNTIFIKKTGLNTFSVYYGYPMKNFLITFFSSQAEAEILQVLYKQYQNELADKRSTKQIPEIIKIRNEEINVSELICKKINYYEQYPVKPFYKHEIENIELKKYLESLNDVDDNKIDLYDLVNQFEYEIRFKRGKLDKEAIKHVEQGNTIYITQNAEEVEVKIYERVNPIGCQGPFYTDTTCEKYRIGQTLGQKIIIKDGLSIAEINDNELLQYFNRLGNISDIEEKETIKSKIMMRVYEKKDYIKYTIYYKDETGMKHHTCHPHTDIDAIYEFSLLFSSASANEFCLDNDNQHIRNIIDKLLAPLNALRYTKLPLKTNSYQYYNRQKPTEDVPADLVFCDSPGFIEERNHAEQVWIPKSIELAVGIAKELKSILIVSSFDDATAQRGKGLLRALSSVASLFKIGKYVLRLFNEPLCRIKLLFSDPTYEQKIQLQVEKGVYLVKFKRDYKIAFSNENLRYVEEKINPSESVKKKLDALENISYIIDMEVRRFVLGEVIKHGGITLKNVYRIELTENNQFCLKFYEDSKYEFENRNNQYARIIANYNSSENPFNHDFFLGVEEYDDNQVTSRQRVCLYKDDNRFYLKFSLDGVMTVLHSFPSNFTDMFDQLLYPPTRTQKIVSKLGSITSNSLNFKSNLLIEQSSSSICDIAQVWGIILKEVTKLYHNPVDYKHLFTKKFLENIELTIERNYEKIIKQQLSSVYLIVTKTDRDVNYTRLSYEEKHKQFYSMITNTLSCHDDDSPTFKNTIQFIKQFLVGCTLYLVEENRINFNWVKEKATSGLHVFLSRSSRRNYTLYYSRNKKLCKHELNRLNENEKRLIEFFDGNIDFSVTRGVYFLKNEYELMLNNCLSELPSDFRVERHFVVINMLDKGEQRYEILSLISKCKGFDKRYLNFDMLNGKHSDSFREAAFKKVSSDYLKLYKFDQLSSELDDLDKMKNKSEMVFDELISNHSDRILKLKKEIKILKSMNNPILVHTDTFKRSSLEFWLKTIFTIKIWHWYKANKGDYVFHNASYRPYYDTIIGDDLKSSGKLSVQKYQPEKGIYEARYDLKEKSKSVSFTIGFISKEKYLIENAIFLRALERIHSNIDFIPEHIQIHILSKRNFDGSYLVEVERWESIYIVDCDNSYKVFFLNDQNIVEFFLLNKDVYHIYLMAINESNKNDNFPINRNYQSSLKEKCIEISKDSKELFFISFRYFGQNYRSQIKDAQLVMKLQKLRFSGEYYTDENLDKLVYNCMVDIIKPENVSRDEFISNDCDESEKISINTNISRLVRALKENYGYTVKHNFDNKTDELFIALSRLLAEHKAYSVGNLLDACKSNTDNLNNSLLELFKTGKSKLYNELNITYEFLLLSKSLTEILSSLQYESKSINSLKDIIDASLKKLDSNISDVSYGTSSELLPRQSEVCDLPSRTGNIQENLDSLDMERCTQDDTGEYPLLK